MQMSTLAKGHKLQASEGAAEIQKEQCTATNSHLPRWRLRSSPSVCHCCALVRELLHRWVQWPVAAQAEMECQSVLTFEGHARSRSNLITPAYKTAKYSLNIPRDPRVDAANFSGLIARLEIRVRETYTMLSGALVSHLKARLAQSQSAIFDHVAVQSAGRAMAHAAAQLQVPTRSKHSERTLSDAGTTRPMKVCWVSFRGCAGAKRCKGTSAHTQRWRTIPSYGEQDCRGRSRAASAMGPV